MAYAAPPDPFDPLLETWAAGQTIWRCHAARLGPLEPNPTASAARFRPVYLGSDIIPTSYGAGDEQAALAEGAFHNLPVRSAAKLQRALTDKLALSPLNPERELELVSLRGHGLRRLGQTQRRLIEPGRQVYAASAAWGQAAYNHSDEPDGVCWTSRQFPGGTAMLLYWDRCGADVSVGGPTLPLAVGRGFELLCEAANAANIVIVG